MPYAWKAEADIILERKNKKMDKKALLKAKENYTFDDLLDILKILRAPGGCPWDAEQTHQSIRADFIEEVYEAIEGIDANDDEIMKEELGDVLLQVVFHSRIADDDNRFDITDILNGICHKLIVRHPHVFGDVSVSSTEEVLDNWNTIKMQTKGQKSAKESVQSISKSLPSLMRAEKTASKLHKYDIPYATVEDIVKLSQQLDGEESIGKLLYAVTSYAKSVNADAEKCLYDQCDKVIENV